MATVRSKAKREALRDSLWGPEIATSSWPQEVEHGWCKVPRVTPIVLRILDEKAISGDMDLSRTYLGLLAENMGDGLVEIADEGVFARTAGLRGDRGVRSWRERVRRLKEIGLIDFKQRGSSEVGFVLVLRPYRSMRRLRAEGRVPEGWWALYRQRLIDVGAAEFDRTVQYRGKEYGLMPIDGTRECIVTLGGRSQGLLQFDGSDELIATRDAGGATALTEHQLVEIGRIARFDEFG